MSAFVIEVNYFKNQKHTIYLGDCEWLHFKNKRYVRDYLVRYKRMLKTHVGVINNLNVQAYSLFRGNYSQLNFNTRIHLNGLFGDYMAEFEMIFRRYSPGNQNAFMLGRIEACYQNVLSCVIVLKEHAQKNKNYALRDQVNILIKMTEDELERFGIDKRDLNLHTAINSKLKIMKSSEKLIYNG